MMPHPVLEYRFHREHPRRYLGGDLPIASVTHVSARMQEPGRLVVTVTGPMLKKDGTPGSQHRSSRADATKEQPDWLLEIIRDAERRLR